MAESNRPLTPGMEIQLQAMMQQVHTLTAQVQQLQQRPLKDIKLPDPTTFKGDKSLAKNFMKRIEKFLYASPKRGQGEV
jgi:hypothetical protein